ncbi:STE3-domain-containing protein [Coprinopsis marcescibilis]|uniref:STE3-domain-containing protein n=1 Tax=Coprinopsis marcescibilis TaxID=230819 RepID=A0A5C3L310_COPMA|nr:STE3-domain-containing protein [Coprinopsis marcescibilis]
MAAPLIAISILNAILLAVFLPVKRIYSDIPSLALVIWLLLANIIHAINSVAWSGNLDFWAPTWCDIATKLLLGVNVAVPGALICIGRNLELVSSSRKIVVGAIVKRNSVIFEVVCCIFLPFVYMVMHMIPQDFRFDLSKDYGCSASAHPSTPALIAIWALPILLSVIALLLGGLSIHHSFRKSNSAFGTHLSERSAMTTSHFFRRLTTGMAIAGVSVVAIIFSLFSIPTLQPWNSWDDVHAHVSRINVVVSRQELGNISFDWWRVAVLSIIYIIFSFAAGEETRDSYKWMKAQYARRDQILQSIRCVSISFPVRRRQTDLPLPIVTPAKSANVPRETHMVELKSGWDDMADFKYPKSPISTKRSKSSLRSPPSSPISSRSASALSMRGGDTSTTSTGPNMTAEDTAFMNSTISYLGSPPAHALGVTSPLEAPRPVHSVQRKAIPPLLLTIADPVLPRGEPDVPTPAVRSPRARPGIPSVFQAEWPVPPTSPSPVSSASSRYDRSRSPTYSIGSSIDDDAGISPYTSRGPIRPFEGSSVPSPRSRTIGLPSPISPERGPSLKRSIQNLRMSWERMRHPSTSTHSEGIIMTVVQETV